MSKSKTRRLLKILMPSRGPEKIRNQNRSLLAFPRELWLEEYQGSNDGQTEEEPPPEKLN